MYTPAVRSLHVSKLRAIVAERAPVRTWTRTLTVNASNKHVPDDTAAAARLTDSLKRR